MDGSEPKTCKGGCGAVEDLSASGWCYACAYTEWML